FDDQSDDLPQPLTPIQPSHPIMQGKSGPLTVFPDHMHEGEVTLPWSLNDVLSFSTTSGTQSFTEYPTAAGHQETPIILATATVQGGHSTIVDDGHVACENNNFSPAPELTFLNKPPLNV